MLFKNDYLSFDMLYNTVSSFYTRDIARRFVIFETKSTSEAGDTDLFVRFLVDAKHVIEYRITNDRGYAISVLSLAIGPHYFFPGDFWDYSNSQRFSLEASSDAVGHNLELLDEFLTQR